MNETLTMRERVLRTFQRKPIDRIVWQPRIYYWYYGNRLQNKLPEGYKGEGLLEHFKNIPPYDGQVPERFKDKTMIEMYDAFNASPRYPQEVLGVHLFHTKVYNKKIKTETRIEGNTTTAITETPLGNLCAVSRHGYSTEYSVKSPQDMRVMQYILDSSEFTFDAHAFEVCDKAFGDRGPLHSFYPRAPLQRLIVSYMGFENTTYALVDYPEETHEFLKAIDRWDDGMYEVLLSSPLQFFNFGENIDANVDSPRLFKEYLIPYYHKRVAQIHEKGRFCHIHMDGALKPLLPLINEAGFDGIEAATPLAQGDVTLEELKEAMGDTILLDGIPAIMFLPSEPLENLEAFAYKVLEMFSPNLILGVSDEVPPPADIERVGLVSKIVEEFEPYP